MVLITAKATGNWSAGSTWDSDPALPGAGDVAECAGYTVTIDQDVTVTTLQSSGAGYFAVSAARTIVGAVLSNTGHSGGGVVRCSHAAGTVSITGAVTAGPSRGVDLSGAGTVTITGAVTGGSAASAIGAYNASTGALNITGNVTGGSTTNCQGALNGSTGTMTITGNVTGGAGTLAHGVLVSSGVVTITGNATGGGGSSANGAHASAAASTVTVQGICYSCAAANAFGLYGANASGKAIFRRAVFSTSVGAPLGGYVQIDVTTPTTNYAESPRSDTGAAYKLSNNYPAVTDVRDGTTYHLGTQTGTVTLPAEADVELGVLYGAGGTEYEGALNAPTAADIATAVLAAMNADPPAVNLTQWKGGTPDDLSGDGEVYAALTNAQRIAIQTVTTFSLVSYSGNDVVTNSATNLGDHLIGALVWLTYELPAP